MAESLKEFADALEGTPEEDFAAAALEYCKKTLNEHRRILFSGDGYSDEWQREAERRGLSNLRTTADALPAMVAEKNLALWTGMGVLTETEAFSRYEVKLEKYDKLMNIEATTMIREARRTYRPAITAYATKVAKGLEIIRGAGADAAMTCEQNTLNKLCAGITEINEAIKALDALHQRAEGLIDPQEQANCSARGRPRDAAPARRRGRHGGDRGRRLLAGPDLRRHPVLRVGPLRASASHTDSTDGPPAGGPFASARLRGGRGSRRTSGSPARPVPHPCAPPPSNPPPSVRAVSGARPADAVCSWGPVPS